MTDPRRLLDDPTLDEGARAALRAAKAQRGDASRREAIWAAIAPGLPPVPEGGASDLPGAPDPSLLGPGAAAAGAKATTAGQSAALGSKAAGWLGFAKAGALGAGVMSALLGAQTLLTPPPEPPKPLPALSAPRATLEPAPRAHEPISGKDPPSTPRVEAGPSGRIPTIPAPPRAVNPEASPAPAEPPPTPERSAPEATTAAPTPAPAESAPASTAASEALERAREEARLVREADQALRRGDAGGALRTLEELRQRFPGGVLGQEREVLTIEALSRSGQGAQASARAEVFLARNPASPFAGRVRPLVQNKKPE
jgi:hypothetical protein